MTEIPKRTPWQEIVFFTILALVLAFRFIVLQRFTFVLMDSDQTIMWSAAIDFSRGIFHEPRFYGQEYSTMLEALFAVPLIWCGIPVYYAVPVITMLMSMTPFLLIAFIARSRGQFAISCLVLLFPMLMPMEYNFINSMPRGFIPGIFVASFGALAFFHPRNPKGWVVAGFLAVFGYTVNPNSALLSLPILVYLGIQNFPVRKFYLLSGAGIAAGLVIHLLVAAFYLLHPNHIIHPAIKFMMTMNQFTDFAGNMNKVFGYVTPVFWNLGGILPVLFLLFGIGLFAVKKVPEGWVMIFSLVLILVSLSVKQVAMASESIFYSYSRMYLAVPVILALFLPFLPLSFPKQATFLLILAAGLFFSRINTTNRTVDERVWNNKVQHVVSFTTDKTFFYKCNQIRNYSRVGNISLVIEVQDFFYDFITYGCAACDRQFPETLRPDYERRTWRLEEERTKIHPNILIVDFGYKLPLGFDKLDKLHIRHFSLQGFYFIRGNTLPTLELMKLLNIPVRAF
jgi:hypothetical protein